MENLKQKEAVFPQTGLTSPRWAANEALGRPRNGDAPAINPAFGPSRFCELRSKFVPRFFMLALLLFSLVFSACTIDPNQKFVTVYVVNKTGGVLYASTSGWLFFVDVSIPPGQSRSLTIPEGGRISIHDGNNGSYGSRVFYYGSDWVIG
jgi:hypothetical protein